MDDHAYIIELEPYEHYIEAECPIMGVRVTHRLYRAQAYSTKAAAWRDADKFQRACKSDAVMTVREIRIEVC